MRILNFKKGAEKYEEIVSTILKRLTVCWFLNLGIKVSMIRNILNRSTNGESLPQVTS